MGDEGAGWVVRVVASLVVFFGSVPPLFYEGD